MAVNGVSNSNGVTVNTPYEDANKMVSVDDFLQLMIAEMTNQDFESQTDSSQYITQLAQITTMQQMQQLAYYSQSNYVMSLVGKEVTAASLSYGGKVNQVTGPVEKIALTDGEFLVYVGGKGYQLSQIMTVNSPGSVESGDEAILGKLKDSIVIPQYVRDDSAKVRWNAPEVGDDTKEKLTYQVYYIKAEDAGDSNTFDSPELVKKGKLAGTVDKDVYEYKIEDLDPDTKYYCNVLVTSTDGKEYVYEKSFFTTKQN